MVHCHAPDPAPRSWLWLHSFVSTASRLCGLLKSIVNYFTHRRGLSRPASPRSPGLPRPLLPRPWASPVTLRFQAKNIWAVARTRLKPTLLRSWPKFILKFIVAKRQFGDVFQAFFKGIKKPLKAILWYGFIIILWRNGLRRSARPEKVVRNEKRLWEFTRGNTKICWYMTGIGDLEGCHTPQT